MSNEELETAKQKMMNYKDLFGGELNNKHLIKDAKNVIDLENILNDHHDYIGDMANDAQNSLSRFKRKIGVF